MKKIILILLLFISLKSYSQNDTTQITLARQKWLSNPDNWSQGQSMPNFDLDGNIIPFVSLILVTCFFITTYKKKIKVY
jgi:hypothetical protein